MKVVINSCFGGFSLSRAAFLRLRELGNAHALAEPDVGEKWSDGSGPRSALHIEAFCRGIPRDDADLVSVVETMGEDADGGFAELRVIEIPDGISWVVEEYDGSEHIAEVHRTWRR